jgi:hypothetical protein
MMVLLGPQRDLEGGFASFSLFRHHPRKGNLERGRRGESLGRTSPRLSRKTFKVSKPVAPARHASACLEAGLS